jgi:hypothetical protein
MSAFGGKADTSSVKQTSHLRTCEKVAKHPPDKHDKQRHDVQCYIVLRFSRIESSIKPKRRENEARPKQNLAKPCRHVNGPTTLRLLYASTCCAVVAQRWSARARVTPSQPARNVRFWPKADIPSCTAHVRFRRQSGHDFLRCECPLMTQSGHELAAQPPTSSSKLQEHQPTRAGPLKYFYRIHLLLGNPKLQGRVFLIACLSRQHGLS